MRHWTASYGTIPTDIDPNRYASVKEILEAAMRRFASKPALRAFGQTLTYADVDRLSLSKGAALTHRNLVANIEQFKAFMPGAMRPGEEVIVTAIPLYHIFALMVNFLSYFSIGAENWLVANPRDLGSFIDVLKAARPTVFTGVNTLYAGLAANPRLAEVDWSRLRLSVGGGAAVIGTVSGRWKAVTGNFIREGYGLSETSPVVSFNPQFIDEFSGTTGLPMPSTYVKLLDNDGREVTIGQPGEICVQGPRRRARRQDRRSGQALRRPHARLGAHRGAAARPLPREPGGLQAAALRPLRRRAAEVDRRQDPAARVARRRMSLETGSPCARQAGGRT